MKLKELFGCSPSPSSKKFKTKPLTFKKDYYYPRNHHHNNGNSSNGLSSSPIEDHEFIGGGGASGSSAAAINGHGSSASRNHHNFTTHLDTVDSVGFNSNHSNSNFTCYDNHERYYDGQQQNQPSRTISHSLSDSSGGVTSSSSGGSGTGSGCSSQCSLRIGDRVVWFREDYNTGNRSIEFGTVRWIGFIETEDIAGIEFDKALGLGSGWYKNELLFHCEPDHGGLVAVAGLLLEEDYLQQAEERQAAASNNIITTTNSIEQRKNSIIVPINNNMPHASPPWIQPPLSQDDCDRINGRDRGVQGHRNSCYLDATLFSMFSFSSVFDSILTPPLEYHQNGLAASSKNSADNELGHRVRQILRENIVNPLRKELFTPAGNVMKLREIMKHLDEKIISEEMDPQEFLQILFNRVLQLPEFLSLSLGQNDYFHQVLVTASPSDIDKKRIPSVQSLLEQSFMGQKLKFKTIPNPALILQMPRSGNKYRTYEGILPNLTIDITDLLQDTPRICAVCGEFATHECPDCYGMFSSSSTPTIPSGLASDSTSFCSQCVKLVHAKRDRSSHSNITKLEFSFDPSNYFATQDIAGAGAGPSIKSTAGGGRSRFSLPNYNPTSYFGGSSSSASSPNVPHKIPRITMDLFAVICIETSHFVSFVKCGPGREAPWVFFDSMADRIESSYDGSGQGQNIPNVKHLPKLGVWLDKLERDPGGLFLEKLDSVTPELKRLITDSYICLYYSPQSSMYS